jgi:hypothetical protein
MLSLSFLEGGSLHCGGGFLELARRRGVIAPFSCIAGEGEEGVFPFPLGEGVGGKGILRPQTVSQTPSRGFATFYVS